MGAENLKPIRSQSEAKAKGKAGGVKSGEARREKKALRERLELLLAKKIDGVETADAICIALIDKALTGDARAWELIRDTLGEKPEQKTELSGGLVIRWEDGSGDSAL